MAIIHIQKVCVQIQHFIPNTTFHFPLRTLLIGNLFISYLIFWFCKNQHKNFVLFAFPSSSSSSSSSSWSFLIHLKVFCFFFCFSLINLIWSDVSWPNFLITTVYNPNSMPTKTPIRMTRCFQLCFHLCNLNISFWIMRCSNGVQSLVLVKAFILVYFFLFFSIFFFSFLSKTT